MNNLITILLMAQRCAQVHHWKTKSFARHLALEELYEALVAMTDRLVEEASGESGTDFLDSVDQSQPNAFNQQDEVAFIGELHDILEKLKDSLPDLDWLENTYEELQSQVAKIKYKMENLR